MTKSCQIIKRLSTPGSYRDGKKRMLSSKCLCVVVRGVHFLQISPLDLLVAGVEYHTAAAGSCLRSLSANGISIVCLMPLHHSIRATPGRGGLCRVRNSHCWTSFH